MRSFVPIVVALGAFVFFGAACAPDENIAFVSQPLSLPTCPTRQPAGDVSAIQNMEADLRDTGDTARYRLLAAKRVWNEDLADHVDYGYFCDVANGMPETRIVLSSTGENLTEPEVQKRAIAARKARFGKLGKVLFDKLPSLDSNDEIEVEIWHVHHSVPSPNLDDVKSTTDARQAWSDYQAAFDQANTVLRVQARAAVEKYGRVLRQLKRFPVIEARVRVGALAALAALPEVGLVTQPAPRSVASAGYSYFKGADDMEIAESFTLAQPSYQGYGVKVGIFESKNYCRVWTGHSGLNFPWYVAQGSPGSYMCSGKQDGDRCLYGCGDFSDEGYCRGGVCMADHATRVASMIGAIRGTEINNARRVSLFDANSNAGSSSKLDWLDANNVRIINDSTATGGDNYTGHWPALNYAARELHMTVAKAAGNKYGNLNRTKVDCPDNTICVGAYEISGSGVDAWKYDPLDQQNHYEVTLDSLWKNSGRRHDAEKPDLVGPNQDDQASPDPDLWSKQSGTSFAAPMIAGLVALWHESEVYWWFPLFPMYPSRARAGLMASAAAHNVNGSALSRNDPYTYWTGLDEDFDGAGAPIARLPVSVISHQVSESLFGGTGYWEPTTLYVYPGQSIRVILSWNACSEAGSTFLGTNFDLILIDTAAQVSLDYSNSATNTVEMVEWKNTTGAGKTVTIRISRQGTIGTCGGQQTERLSYAFLQHYYH